MAKATCQGYCGGKYPLSEMERVGIHGELMCEECAEKARSD